jgi:hypothetical protein
MTQLQTAWHAVLVVHPHPRPTFHVEILQGWKWAHFIHEKMVALSKNPKNLHVNRENDD